MIKIPEKEGRLSAAKAAHIEAVIAFVKRKTEGYRRDLFANISRVMLVSGTFEDMSARDDWSWLSDFILADVKTLKQMIGRPSAQFDELRECIPIISVPEVINMWMRQRNIMRTCLLKTLVSRSVPTVTRSIWMLLRMEMEEN